MGNIKKQIRRASKRGVQPLDLMKMKSIADKQAQKMKDELAWDAFRFMMLIPINVLAEEYWPKTAKKKLPTFIDEVVKLYEAVQSGAVKEEDLKAVLRDAGYEINDTGLMKLK